MRFKLERLRSPANNNANLRVDFNTMAQQNFENCVLGFSWRNAPLGWGAKYKIRSESFRKRDVESDVSLPRSMFLIHDISGHLDHKQ